MTETTSNLGTRHLDDNTLRGLVEPLQTTVTVYLPAKNDHSDGEAGHRLQMHWSNLRRSLANRGASDADLDAIDPVTTHGDERGDTIVAIATNAELRAVGFITEPIAEPLGTIQVMPALLPFLGWDQSRIPHLVVVADRTGADIIAVSPHQPDTGTTIDGDDLYIQRSAPGGWSQRRYQQRAENLWEHNAKDVAATVDQLANSCHAQIIVLAGDVRALGFLRQHLPSHVNDLVCEIDGSRADWSLDQIADDTVTHVAALGAQQLQQHHEALTEALGIGKAVEGRDAVFQALRQARVDTLHVVDDTNGPRPTGWTSADPAHSYAQIEPPNLGTRVSHHQAPLHDIAIRSAVLTGARIVIIPPDQPAPAQGLAALLRGDQ